MKSVDRIPITVACMKHMTVRGLFRSSARPISPSSHSSPSQSKNLFIDLGLDGGRCSDFSVNLATRENGPGDTRHLVGQRDRDQANRLFGEQPAHPFEPAGNGLALVADKAGGADDQEASEISIARLGDATETVLAPGRILTWHQAEPGGELPTRFEYRDIGHRRGKGRGDDRSDPGNGCQIAA